MVQSSGPYIPMTANRGLRLGSDLSSSWNKKLISRQAAAGVASADIAVAVDTVAAFFSATAGAEVIVVKSD